MQISDTTDSRAAVPAQTEHKIVTHSSFLPEWISRAIYSLSRSFQLYFCICLEQCCNKESIYQWVNRGKKRIGNYSDNWLTVSVVSQAEMSNICWFQPSKHEHLLLFFVTFYSKWREFGFWNVDWTKEAICRRQIWALRIHDEPFSYFFWTI